MFPKEKQRERKVSRNRSACEANCNLIFYNIKKPCELCEDYQV